MSDLARCQDHECPSRSLCMRYCAPGEEPGASVIDFKRGPTAKRCVVGWWPFDEEGQQRQLAAQAARRRTPPVSVTPRKSWSPGREDV